MGVEVDDFAHQTMNAQEHMAEAKILEALANARRTGFPIRDKPLDLEDFFRGRKTCAWRFEAEGGGGGS
jgi:hypothetical protein